MVSNDIFNDGQVFLDSGFIKQMIINPDRAMQSMGANIDVNKLVGKYNLPRWAYFIRDISRGLSGKNLGAKEKENVSKIIEHILSSAKNVAGTDNGTALIQFATRLKNIHVVTTVILAAIIEKPAIMGSIYTAFENARDKSILAGVYYGTMARMNKTNKQPTTLEMDATKAYKAYKEGCDIAQDSIAYNAGTQTPLVVGVVQKTIKFTPQSPTRKGARRKRNASPKNVRNLLLI